MLLNESVMDLYSDFIKLRQSGDNRDDAWYAVLHRAEVRGYSEKQVKNLLALAKRWETREGHKYHVRSASSAHDTISRQPDITETQSVIRPILPPKANHTTLLDPSILRALENAKTTQVKIELGGSTAKLATAQRAEQRQFEASYFGDNSVIAFHIKDLGGVIEYPVPSDTEVLIGRTTPNAAMSPDIDFTDLDQGQYGISRMHAALNRHEDKLMIQDLGSANHTYLNDERLFPHELRMLKDGDVLSLGRMLVQVRFLHC